jgi:hypothetical protein
MIGNWIMAKISSLTSAAPKFATHAGSVTENSVTIQSNTGNLISTMSGVPELGSFSTNLEGVGQNLKSVMQCHADALMRTNQGLMITAQSYQKVDSTLAQTMNNLAINMQGYTGYETPITSGTPPITPGGQPIPIPIIGGIWSWITTHK